MKSIHGIKTPIIALAPMDGVTDAAYRFVQKKYGRPDLIFTEFTNVVGLCKGAEKLFLDLLYSPIERPVIAQLFGQEPEYFYHATKIAAALGFNGVDINMGCPAKKVADRGSGAGLINQPELALEIIASCRNGARDFFQNRALTGVAANVEQIVSDMNTARNEKLDWAELAANFTISVKTRIGFKENTVTTWIPKLAEAAPDWISVHGRTFKQMYTGEANWGALADAVASTSISVLVNGDVASSNDIVAILNQTQAAGVMLGRATYGNPWIFSAKEQVLAALEAHSAGNIIDYTPTFSERTQVMLDHARLHWQSKGARAFIQMRKNLAWYIKNLPGAAKLRAQLVVTNNPEEVENLLNLFASQAN